MFNYLASATTGSYSLLFDVLLGVLALIWLGVLIGIIVDSKKKYGIFEDQKQLILQVNSDKNAGKGVILHPSKWYNKFNSLN